MKNQGSLNTPKTGELKPTIHNRIKHMKDYTDVISYLNAGVTASTLTAVLCEAASS